MATGTVKWFSDEKGYGFIAQDGGPDAFVHYTGIADGGFRTLPEGARVKFEVRPGRKGGLEAFDVIVIGQPEQPRRTRPAAGTERRRQSVR